MVDLKLKSATKRQRLLLVNRAIQRFSSGPVTMVLLARGAERIQTVLVQYCRHSRAATRATTALKSVSVMPLALFRLARAVNLKSKHVHVATECFRSGRAAIQLSRAQFSRRPHAGVLQAVQLKLANNI